MNSYVINENLSQKNFSKRVPYLGQKNVNIPEFNWFSGGIYGNVMYNMAPSPTRSPKMEAMADPQMELSGKVAGLSVKRDSTVKTKSIEEKKLDLHKIPVRQNLNETAFFYPNLMTD